MVMYRTTDVLPTCLSATVMYRCTAHLSVSHGDVQMYCPPVCQPRRCTYVLPTCLSATVMYNGALALRSHGMTGGHDDTPPPAGWPPDLEASMGARLLVPFGTAGALWHFDRLVF